MNCIEQLVFKPSIDFLTLSLKITDPQYLVNEALSALRLFVRPVGNSLIKKLDYRMNNCYRSLVMYSFSNQYGQYFVLSFIPSRMTLGDYCYLVNTVNTVLSPIGKSFKDVFNDAKVTRLDVAYDAPVDMASMLFSATNFQSSGIATQWIRFYLGPNPRTAYIGSESSTRFCVYDYGYCHRKKGDKIADVIGKITRVELRLKPREFVTLNQAEVNDSKCRKLKKLIKSYIERIKIQAPSKPVARDSVLHLFLRASEQEGYQKLLAEQKKYNPKRAKIIQSQLKLVSIDREKMVRDANTQIKMLVRELRNAMKKLLK